MMMKKVLGKSFVVVAVSILFLSCAVYVYAESVDQYTKLLIHSDSFEGDTTIIDSSNSSHTIQVSGDTHHSIEKANFGLTSIKFDGSGDYLTIADSEDWDFNSQDFTIDCWINTTSTARIILYVQGTGGNHSESMQSLMIDLFPGSQFILGYKGTAIHDERLYNPPVIHDGEWHHIAAVRYANELMLFVDGIRYMLVDISNDPIMNNSAYPVTIGRYSDTFNGEYYNGYIDEYRISKGIARWTSNFIPPEEPNGSCQNADYDGDGIVNSTDLIKKQNDILLNIQDLQNELKSYTECWESQNTCP